MNPVSGWIMWCPVRKQVVNGRAVSGQYAFYCPLCKRHHRGEFRETR